MRGLHYQCSTCFPRTLQVHGQLLMGLNLVSEPSQPQTYLRRLELLGTQVWSLTQFYSVGVSLSRTSAKEWVFLKIHNQGFQKLVFLLCSPNFWKARDEVALPWRPSRVRYRDKGVAWGIKEDNILTKASLIGLVGKSIICFYKKLPEKIELVARPAGTEAAMASD